ncbi:GNAT family N-acetyltransferase [Cellulomonas sp. JZ18]|uniref:GNAT family N-acetyltransferase n=1 Tax=Cellulomonas sp. JZ18 TaxID=2654191 RepID=UPI0012D418A0|nr:GNAT family N-acetyltransferase [Cellulomonas sp. JZ18]QGQ18981.1 GNAT family N-acetyltransferase [Cellulomonas sp. JZ18]
MENAPGGPDAADPSPAARRARTAHADAWEQQALVRRAAGGATAHLPGIRVMTSGLDDARWNHGDVTDPGLVDVTAVSAWFASRGVRWGVRVPAGTPWTHGRLLLRTRLMTLDAPDLRPVAPVPGLRVRAAGPQDLPTVLDVDAAAFGGAVAQEWIRPHLVSSEITTALAELDGVPVATAYVVRSDGLAGPAAYLAGVGVRPEARRRGVAAAVSAWLLRDAFGRGCRFAHLHPDDDAAARVYARLGFTEVDGLDVYVDVA